MRLDVEEETVTGYQNFPRALAASQEELATDCARSLVQDSQVGFVVSGDNAGIVGGG